MTTVPMPSMQIKCHRSHWNPTSELQSSGGLWKYGLDVLDDALTSRSLWHL